MAQQQTRKTVTMLFCDVTGSTALGEQLDPESLRGVIQQYFAEMRAVIERHGGTVEKFIGDAVMAVFGVPHVHEDDALRAVRAAADMQGALSAANEGFERDFGVRIQARIGVNTGEVLAGDPSEEGSSFVSGDAVNVAARLEQAAEPGDVLLGEATYRLVRAAVIAKEIPPLSAKGKSEPLVAYRLVVVEAAGQMLPRRFDVPLVGRESELRMLLDGFEEAVNGPACTIVTLIGEAGLGKSRLAHELSTLVGNRARVLRGRCLPYGEGITFYPLTEILQDAAAIASDDSPDAARAKIAALLPPDDPSLADRLAGLLGATAASGSIQETFLATRRLLESLAAQSPVVAIFDDIQWGEETFLDLLQYLAGFVVGRPLFILCLARPQLLEERSDWSEVGPTIRLQPVDPGSTEVIVANLLGDADTSRGVAETIARSAAGNPLFVEEMLRMLVDDGFLTRHGSEWVVTGDVAAVPAPDTVQAVIAARLDRLPAAELALLQHASVIGEVFWWDALNTLVDQGSPADVGRRLQALVRKDLIRPDPSKTFSEDAFRFGHLLIRDVAYDGLPKKARADMHARFAAWIEERTAGRTAEFEDIVGFHLEQAHRYLREVAPRDERVGRLAIDAAERLGRAGRRSSERGDAPAAINLLNRAMELTPQGESSHLALRFELCEALFYGGRWTDLGERFSRTVEEARELGDRAIEWRARVRSLWLTMHQTTLLKHAEAVPLAEEAAAALEAIGDDQGLAMALNFIGDVYFWLGDCPKALTLYRPALDHALRAQARGLQGEIRGSIMVALVEGTTPVVDVIAELESIMHANEDDRALHVKTHRLLGHVYGMLGQFGRAHEYTQKGIETARELGMDVDLAGGNLRAAADLMMLEGDLATGEAYLREAVDILTKIGDQGHLDSVAPDLALLILKSAGRAREALEIVAIADSALDGDVDAQVRARSAKAIACARLGRIDEAEALGRDAVERAWSTDYLNLRALSAEALAEVLWLGGRMVEAEESMQRAIEAREAKGNIVEAEADRKRLAELRSARVSE